MKKIVPVNQFRRLGVVAGFTTKHFGLLLRKTDDLLLPKNQKEFQKRLREENHFSSCRVRETGRFVVLNQIHGDTLAVLEDKDTFKKKGFYYLPKTDGVITNIPGLCLLVMTADCLPVFFAAGAWVGLAHAGWRGTQKEITKKAWRLLKKKSGLSASEIRVAFGPSIGAQAYEVGEEFKNLFPAGSAVQKRRGRFFFDLAGENRRQLLSAGVPARNIYHSKICTFSEANDFYSFRREKKSAGRIISFIRRGGF